jgi:thiamine biosynthesis protein ThiS
MSETVEITVNGEAKRVPAGSTVEQLVERLDLPRQRVAIELNQQVVRRAEWGAVSVKEGDRLEVVHFVGGG